MKHLRLRFAAIAAMGAVSATIVAQGGGATQATTGPLTLRFNFDKGAKYVYDTVTQMKMSQLGTNFVLTQNMALSVQILDKDDKGFRAKTTIEAVKMDAGNSAQSAALANQATSMKGTSIDVSYDPLGNTRDVSVTSGGAAPQSMGGATGGMSFGFQCLVCPDKPVDIGSTWASSMDIGKMMGQLGMGASANQHTAMPIKYKLAGIDIVGGKPVARIELAIDTPIEFSVMGQDLSGDVTMRGRIHVGIEKGEVLDWTLNGDVNLSVAGHEITQHLSVSSKLRS
jgi:hypothetical protein